MITCALMDMVTTLLAGLYELLPEWSLDIGATAGASGGDIPDLQYTVTGSADPMTGMLVWCQKYNSFFPFDQLAIMVGILATFVAVMVVYRGIRWLSSIKIAGTGIGGGT